MRATDNQLTAERHRLFEVFTTPYPETSWRTWLHFWVTLLLWQPALLLLTKPKAAPTTA